MATPVGTATEKKKKKILKPKRTGLYVSCKFNGDGVQLNKK